MARPAKHWLDRFLEKIDIEGECWVWKGSTHGRYGRITIANNRVHSTHRLMYKITKGDIPENLVLLHSCDNNLCCNPNHLRAGTQLENVHDTISKKRNIVVRGSALPQAKLTEEQVVAIRQDPRIHREIAVEYGVMRQQVSRIKSGSSWKHL